MQDVRLCKIYEVIKTSPIFPVLTEIRIHNKYPDFLAEKKQIVVKVYLFGL